MTKSEVEDLILQELRRATARHPALQNVLNLRESDSQRQAREAAEERQLKEAKRQRKADERLQESTRQADIQLFMLEGMDRKTAKKAAKKLAERDAARIYG